MLFICDVEITQVSLYIIIAGTRDVCLKRHLLVNWDILNIILCSALRVFMVFVTGRAIYQSHSGLKVGLIEFNTQFLMLDFLNSSLTFCFHRAAHSHFISVNSCLFNNLWWEIIIMFWHSFSHCGHWLVCNVGYFWISSMFFHKLSIFYFFYFFC